MNLKESMKGYYIGGLGKRKGQKQLKIISKIIKIRSHGNEFIKLCDTTGIMPVSPENLCMVT